MMRAEFKITGHPPVAAILTLSLASFATAEPAVMVSNDSLSSTVSDELELLKEEETVSIASRYEQSISQAPSNIYVITDEDIRMSGATDIPTILRRVPAWR